MPGSYPDDTNLINLCVQRSILANQTVAKSEVMRSKTVMLQNTFSPKHTLNPKLHFVASYELETWGDYE